MKTLVLSLVLVLGVSAPSRAAAFDFTTFDLSGAWYVLLTFKDDRSEDANLKKFKDFAWHIETTNRGLAIDEYPYVIFDEATEQYRRAAMSTHKGWEPTGLVLDHLRDSVDVASRATRSKRVKGSIATGFESKPAGGGSGAMMMTFSRNWRIDYKAEVVRIHILDSLSGSDDMIGEMEESIVYEINKKVSDLEYSGVYREGHKTGTIRLMRAKERRIVK